MKLVPPVSTFNENNFYLAIFLVSKVGNYRDMHQKHKFILITIRMIPEFIYVYVFELN